MSKQWFMTTKLIALLSTYGMFVAGNSGQIDLQKIRTVGGLKEIVGSYSYTSCPRRGC